MEKPAEARHFPTLGRWLAFLRRSPARSAGFAVAVGALVGLPVLLDPSWGPAYVLGRLLWLGLLFLAVPSLVLASLDALARRAERRVKAPDAPDASPGEIS